MGRSAHTKESLGYAIPIRNRDSTEYFPLTLTLSPECV